LSAICWQIGRDPGAHLEDGPLDGHAGSQRPHGHLAGRLGDAVSVTLAIRSIRASTSARCTSLRYFSINRSSSILGLHLDVTSICLTARRLPPLEPQISQIGNAALIRRQAAALPLDHAFELAYIRAAANEVLRQCRRADGRSRPPWRRAAQRRSQSSYSFLLRCGSIAHFRFRRPIPELPNATAH